ncbi:MAG: sigma-70 family RNA polymerase sigma factor [Phycisphaerae bacterium]|nr:sigma-70 family RNA polymerase sigma factor [Phycisphaerae bacterium]
MLRSLSQGARQAADDLLPLVYDELRRLAQARLAKTPPGQTLQPTALVHEAYLKLVGSEDPGWEGRAHFFGAAARAMRDILVDQARRKASVKRGGGRRRVDAAQATPSIEPPSDDLLSLDEALRRLEKEDSRKGEIVMLRYFAGLSRDETAAALGVSPRTVDREWRYSIAWLHMELSDNSPRRDDG